MKPIITILMLLAMVFMPTLLCGQSAQTGTINISTTILLESVVYIICIVSFIIAIKFSTKQNKERLDKHELLICGTDQKFDIMGKSIDEKFKTFGANIEKAWQIEFTMRDKDLSNRIENTKTNSDHKLEILTSKMMLYQEMIEKLINQINIRNDQIIKDQNEIFEKLNELSVNLGKTCQHHSLNQ